MLLCFALLFGEHPNVDCLLLSASRIPNGKGNTMSDILFIVLCMNV